MKILQFDKDGRLLEIYGSVKEAKEDNEAYHLLSCLFREVKTTGGFIYTFENDERIVRDVEGNIVGLNIFDCIEFPTPEYEYYKSGFMLFKAPEIYRKTEPEDILEFMLHGCYDCDENYVVKYSELNKKYDSAHKVVICWLNNKWFGTYQSVAEARKATGAKYIWGCLLNEVKTSGGFSFKFA